jgi:hypothetical protein
VPWLRRPVSVWLALTSFFGEGAEQPPLGAGRAEREGGAREEHVEVPLLVPEERQQDTARLVAAERQ